MKSNHVRSFVQEVLKKMPDEWLRLTTHRLDIYDESLAKTQFLEGVEALYREGDPTASALRALPTAYDYIRLGHPLSCLLEWTIARQNDLEPSHVISFSSKTMPILAVLRKNLLDGKKSLIAHAGALPASFDSELLQRVYGYEFELVEVDDQSGISEFDGSTIFVSEQKEVGEIILSPNVDFFVNLYGRLGSVMIVNRDVAGRYVKEIQHVRRRETIAMTPANTLAVLKGQSSAGAETESVVEKNKSSVLNSIAAITGADTKALLASSGLSMQYAIVMGMIHDAQQKHPGKPIKIVIPPNCYGGTNDQARRVAACLDNVEVVDLLVDGDHDMVESIDAVLRRVAEQDAVPYIIAEIPTNPRVEVPDLAKLRDVLRAKRKTAKGAVAVDPVFILDQTFCPDVHFLGEDDILSDVRTVAYVSGSKFPSGGLCTAGYCVGNQKASALMETIEAHLRLCDNEATDFHVEVLAKQLPSMNQRIVDAYENTRKFAGHIRETLPAAKINFVSQTLADQGFTPSVFSLELPTKGATEEESEAYKRELNLRLITIMITEIPDESKFCVSYGQLKGCYWTVPATSTQGTTQESHKDYIVRVSLSPDMDVERHKTVFSKFVDTL